MGLSISVGSLARTVASGDGEWVAAVREKFAKVSAALERAGLERHDEPDRLPTVDGRPLWEVSDHGFSYSTIHYLRRFQALSLDDPEWDPTPVVAGDDPADEPAIADLAEDHTSHLICHSDCDGLYVPVEFEEVILDKAVPGKLLGSSTRLLGELWELAPALGIELERGVPSAETERALREIDDSDPFSNEKLAWIGLYTNARLSVAHKTAIVFS
jgi:hypothetical protein